MMRTLPVGHQRKVVAKNKQERRRALRHNHKRASCSGNIHDVLMHRKMVDNLFRAGTTYFALVFSAAFVLGAIRTTVLELPIVLSISWKASAWVVRKQRISSGHIDRIVMGSVAFGLLMMAEFLLAVQAFDKTLPEFAYELISSKPEMVGLAGQIVYALFPLVNGCLDGNLSSSKRIVYCSKKGTKTKKVDDPQIKKGIKKWTKV